MSFVNEILKGESRNIEFTNSKLLPGFALKFQVFATFMSKFQAFSKPGKVNDKIPGFPGFSGRVGTLLFPIATLPYLSTLVI